MKKLFTCLALGTILCSAAIGYAACTHEELQQKATQASTQIQALAQKDMTRFQTMMQELQQKSQEFAANPNNANLDAACSFYDDMIARSK